MPYHPSFAFAPRTGRRQLSPVTTRTLLLAISLATATTSLSEEAPANVPAPLPKADQGPAKAALEKFREGKHSIAIDLARPLAEKGDADALFLMGFAAETGQGMVASRDSALENYKKAINAGHKDAVFRHALILLNSKDAEDRRAAQTELESAAEKDPGNAGRILGEAWMRGTLGQEPDFEKAAEWWKKAADAGDPTSMLMLARLYEGGFGFSEKSDPTQSLDYYKKATDLGEVSAYVPYGSRLLNGPPEIRDEDKGRELLAKAIEEKQITAYLALGDFEENVKENPSAALEQYKAGAEANQADCMLRLASFYLTGKAVEKNEETGREWLVKAVAQGSGAAALELASRLSQDEKPDVQEIYKYLLSASNTGIPAAQNELGLLYVSGNLGLSDPKAGAAWFTAAAKSAFAAAQSNLGTLYERGMGMEPDYNNAGQLYSLAANQGHPAATAGLARLHAAGLGTDQDLVKAWALASLAVERGDEESKAMLGDLTTRLNTEQIAAAKKEFELLKKPAEEVPATK